MVGTTVGSLMLRPIHSLLALREVDAIPIQIHWLPLALPARTARIVRTTIAVTARVDRIMYPHPPLHRSQRPLASPGQPAAGDAGDPSQ